MKRLNEMIDNAEALAAGVKETGRNHRSYKVYTSMSRALAFLCTVHLYLCDGSGWNDQTDRGMVKWPSEKQVRYQEEQIGVCD